MSQPDSQTHPKNGSHKYIYQLQEDSSETSTTKNPRALTLDPVPASIPPSIQLLHLL